MEQGCGSHSKLWFFKIKTTYDLFSLKPLVTSTLTTKYVYDCGTFLFSANQMATDQFAVFRYSYSEGASDDRLTITRLITVDTHFQLRQTKKGRITLKLGHSVTWFVGFVRFAWDFVNLSVQESTMYDVRMISYDLVHFMDHSAHVRIWIMHG